MTNDHTRRDVMAVGALALIGTLAGHTKGQAQTSEDAKPPTAASDSDEGSLIKTRKASCICGKLTVTTKGPDPARVSLCHCKNCQKQTGSAFAIQATFPKEQVTVEGKSTAWKFPVEGATPVPYRNCSRTGATFYFCPECGSTVYYVLAETPGNIGIKVGSFSDPTFPPPMISGFEEYQLPWAMNVASLPMPGGHHN